jgi:hypothetical protein
MNHIFRWITLAAAAQRRATALRPRSPYVALLCLLTALAGISYAQSGPARQTLKGAWNVTIDFQGVIPTCSAPSLMTRDGGVIANACAANESPGYGQWVRTGNNEFAVTFVGLEYGPGGGANGSYKVRAKVSIGNDSQEFIGPFQTDMFDLDGNLIFTVTGTVTGRRVVVESL